MINPQEQWAIQIDVTNKCNRECSNCTRCVPHIHKPFFMSVEFFAKACDALKDFPNESIPNSFTPSRKVVGMLGGEPLLHPQFDELCRTMVSIIPNKEHRGLWTGIRWQSTAHADLIESTFGYINNNLHNSECLHSPVLVASADIIADKQERAAIQDKCWLQEKWSGAITPKGFFFCEVAAALDMLFDGPGGLPVTAGCWGTPLDGFMVQRERWCDRCGISLNLRGRRDSERLDDISKSNLELLKNSPRVRDCSFLLATSETIFGQDDKPWQYLK